jgi:hypothetical protein
VVIERFLQYIEFKHLSLAKVERDLGFSNGYLGKQRDRNGSIGSSVIEKIVSAYPDINVYWFITGEGEMIVDPNSTVKNVFIKCQACIDKERIIKLLEDSVANQKITIKSQERLIQSLDPGYKQTASG